MSVLKKRPLLTQIYNLKHTVEMLQRNWSLLIPQREDLSPFRSNIWWHNKIVYCVRN